MKQPRKPGAPGSVPAVVKALVAELARKEPDFDRVAHWREELLTGGAGYVFALMARVRQAASDHEALALCATLHTMADPRLIDPLKEVAADQTATAHARMVAYIGLQAYHVQIEMPDPPPLDEAAGDAPTMIREQLGEIAKLLDNGDAQLVAESVTMFCTTSGPEMSGLLCHDLGGQFGARALPLLALVAASTDEAAQTAALAGLAAIKEPGALQVARLMLTRPVSTKVKQLARQTAALLEQAGVTMPANGGARITLPPPERWELQRALVSNVDGVGSRIIWLLGRMPRGRMAAAQFCVNDVVGVKDCAGKDSSRKAADRDYRQLLAGGLDPELLIAEADPAYARWLIAEARAKNPAAHFPLPTGLASWLDPFGPPAKTFARPLIFELFDPATLSDEDWTAALLDSDILVDEPGMASWRFPYEVARPFGAELHQLRQQTDADKRADKEEALFDRAAAALFTVEVRQRYQRRLEEMAYVFWQTDQPNLTATCLVTAVELERGKVEVRDIPFAGVMVVNSVEDAADATAGLVDPAEFNQNPWTPIL